jgi:hypothetical protein
MVRERFATVVGRRKEMFRVMCLHGAGVTSKSHDEEWRLLVLFFAEKYISDTAVLKHSGKKTNIILGLLFGSI